MFEVGEKVKVRSGLRRDTTRRLIRANTEMVKHSDNNSEVFIVSYEEQYQCFRCQSVVQGDIWYYLPEWLEPTGTLIFEDEV